MVVHKGKMIIFLAIYFPEDQASQFQFILINMHSEFCHSIHLSAVVTCL